MSACKSRSTRPPSGARAPDGGPLSRRLRLGRPSSAKLETARPATCGFQPHTTIFRPAPPRKRSRDQPTCPRCFLFAAARRPPPPAQFNHIPGGAQHLHLDIIWLHNAWAAGSARGRLFVFVLVFASAAGSQASPTEGGPLAPLGRLDSCAGPRCKSDNAQRGRRRRRRRRQANWSTTTGHTQLQVITIRFSHDFAPAAAAAAAAASN